ncbi:G protein-coupled glucose receptor regulating Gpa2-domain-containing protein [Podospora didyma]|uniref:G protein-coupled glucose receptor regulating Gpa2-domain-containing protein n=1 Tax=Podospora didyma TaxID=330526 RepID=A0AAE0U408_9PEZI|nr:G protein-coupled glucose receptor regulating Gpa2-domain-containing protein [Podospora didyma]
MVHFDIAPREALAAPTDPFTIRAQSVVVMVASIMSILGAGWILASYIAFSNLRTFRHQLILGLTISDCVMALNFLTSSSMNVGGNWIGAPDRAQFCSFNGYMTQVFVIQTDYWVLIIAICTYFILADHKQMSSWVQENVIILWALPWFFSILWASIGMGVTGYGDIGAWCWFTSDEVRLLVNFVPRWAIIAIMLLMYARLYFILFRAHRSFMSFDGDESSNPTGSGSRQLDGTGSGYAQGQTPTRSPRHTRKLKRLARMMLLYPLAYALIWSLPTTIRIYQATSKRSAPWQLQTVDKACVVLQGFVDAMIYGATETSLSSWRNLIFPRAFPTVNGVDKPAASGGDKANKDPRAWGFANAGDKQLLSSPPTRDETSSANNSLEISSTAGTAEDSGGDQMEMKSLKGGTDSSLGIWKTVEVEVLSSGAEQNKPQAVLQKPPKSYFP